MSKINIMTLGLFLLGLFCFTACASAPPVNSAISFGAPESVASGFRSTEGPLWHEGRQSFIFSDIPGDTVYELSWPARELTTLRKPSDNANGLALLNDNTLLMADQKTRMITAMNLTSKETSPFISTFQGAKFNSPNDMTVHENGDLFFTDPPYGLRRDPSRREIEFNGVYLRRASGEVEALERFAQDINPNGILLAPDQSQLYLAISHDESGPIYVYDMDAKANLSNRRIFGMGQNNDGMALDKDGNLYVANRTGVKVLSPTGDEIAFITLPDNLRTTNVTLGGPDGDVLLITNRSADVYVVRVE